MTIPYEAKQDFEDAMRRRNLIPPAGGVVCDGQMHYCNVDCPSGKNGKNDGRYCLHGDTPYAGWFENWQDGIGVEKWKSTRSNGEWKHMSDSERARLKEEQARKREEREAEQGRLQAAATVRAQKIWNEAVPAPADHEYLKAKGILPHDLRVDSDGWLVIPMQAIDGTVSNVQRIKGDGEKLFLKDAPVRGNFYYIGPKAPGAVIVEVEGVATGLSVYESEGLPVVAAMNAGNLQPVAESVKATFPDSRLVFFADNDDPSGVGFAKATEAARAVGGTVCMSPVPGEDANDVYRRGGAKEVTGILDSAASPPEATQEAPAEPEGAGSAEDDETLVPAEEPPPAEVQELPVVDTSPPKEKPRPALFESLSALLASQRPQKWLVHGRVESPSTILVFGPSTSGKTFVMVDLAGATATSTPWAGREVTGGPVYYLCGEGKVGLLRRFQAWQLQRKVAIPKDRLFISTVRIELNELGATAVETEVERITTEIGASPALLIIDTMARALPFGSDENSAKDAGAFINICDRIRDRFNCVVAIVHHTGTVDDRRARGSTALKAAMDAELLVAKKGIARVAEWTKLKDLADELYPQEFILKPEILGQSEDGEMVTSAVVEWHGRSAARPTVSTTKAENLALDLLRKLGGTTGQIGLDAWRAEFFGQHWGDCEETKRKAFNRARAGLAEKNLIQIEDGRYTLPPKKAR